MHIRVDVPLSLAAAMLLFALPVVADTPDCGDECEADDAAAPRLRGVNRARLQATQSATVEGRTPQIRVQGTAETEAYDPDIGGTPGAVDILSVTSTENALEVVHGPVPSGVRRSAYKLDRAEGFWRRFPRGVAYDPATRTWTDPHVTLGHEYCYRILTHNEAGEQGTGALACGVFDGGDASVRPPAPAMQVEIVRSEPNLHVLSFTDGSDNETGFEVQRWNGSGLPWVDVANLPASQGTGEPLQIADDGVDMEIRYCYRVRTLGEHSHALSRVACALTPPLAPAPAESPRQPRPFVIRRPDSRKLTVLWSDHVNTKEWRVWLYNANDLDNPIKSARVRDRRTPRRPVQGTTFDHLIEHQLYCVRVMRMNRQPDTRPVLCESPHGRRRSVTHVGPSADRVPRLTGIQPIPEGLLLTLAEPREGQLIDLVSEDQRRFTHLGARSGVRQVRIDGLDAEKIYCARPWVFGLYASRYGEQMCATTLPPEDEPPPEEITYSTRLLAQVPEQGVVPYVHVVEPGPPRPAQLLRVRVIGNAFSGYNLRFVRPEPGLVSCDDGVTIVPGDVLSGPALASLFGAETPTIPQTGLALVACKLLRTPAADNTNPVPIDVTYRRP